MNGTRILAIDDDVSSCRSLEEILQVWGYKTLAVSDSSVAVQKAQEFRPELVLSDIKMPGKDGFGLLRELRGLNPQVPVVFLTGGATIECAIEATRSGAFDFLEKPIDVQRLKACIHRALDRKDSGKVAPIDSHADDEFEFVGRSTEMLRVFEMIKRVAPARAAVTIGGESGTGKEMVAQAIHKHSLRRGKPFVAINCASIPATLIESELFGHERGAFTGAEQRRQGVFELAHGGTLFLDEVGEIPIELQSKLLRILEEGKLRRLGGKSEITVDVRLVSATNRELRMETKAQRFREDLYFRLCVFELKLPPLRNRKDDIPLLAEHFIRRFAAEARKEVSSLTEVALERLMAYDWPGNIRELRNALERAVILCDGARILPEHLPSVLSNEKIDGDSFSAPLGKTLDEIEKAYILTNLKRNNNNKARTADMLGISEKTLYNKLHRYAGEQVPELSVKTSG